MLLNAETVLIGTHCFLVPYRREHVLKYHEWMQDADILQATDSEPLSLEEEYEMQQTWRIDPDKCTFIVLDASQVDDGTTRQQNFVAQNLHAMVGDVNLFLSEDEEEGIDANDTTTFQQAEIDIMIAEKEARRKGIGFEACCIMMLYATENLSIRRFFCKINEDNASSLALFEKLGFQQCNYAECFRQVELELKSESPDVMACQLRRLLQCDTLKSFQCPLL